MDILKEGLLKTDPGLLLWTVITFLILFLILWKTAWGPIVEALDSRAEKIKGDIQIAEKTRLDSEELLEKHKNMITVAREEAAEIISKSKEDAQILSNEIISNAEKESEKMIQKAKKEILTTKEKALTDIKSEIVDLSTQIASKLISKNLKPEENKSFIEEALDKIKTVQ